MSANREYDPIPYLMSGIRMRDVENAIIEKVESIHERSRLIQSVEVKPKVIVSMVAATSSTSDSISSMNKKLKKGDIWLLIYLMLYVSYLILGSLAFRSMELETEVELKMNFRDARLRFQQKYSNVIDDDIEKFIAEVLKLSSHGLSPLRNASMESNWSFGHAVFFSSTVITTIGYGHVTPLSPSGKLFCIFYAIAGIPLTLVLLTAAVKRLLVPSAWIFRQINVRLEHLYQPLTIRLLHLVVIVITCGIMFLGIPSIVFARLEADWSKLDAFYYCFISLTTIGLGDFIPGDQLDQPNRSIYKIAITVYLFLGLIAVMLNLAVFCEIPQLNLGQLFSESECVGEFSKEEQEKLRVHKKILF